MHLFKHKGPTIFLIAKCFASSSAKNHYTALGVTPKATQNDIKSAYYKLSMIYHPDKNKSSETAADKFREITEAYEVLGDFKLRKLYDKGLLHTVGARQAPSDASVNQKDDDPQTKFYKSRFRRTEATGRTPIYDFDEWSRMHYGDYFAKKRAAHVRYEAQRAKEAPILVPKEKLTVVLVLILVMFMANFYTDQRNDAVARSDVPPNQGKS